MINAKKMHDMKSVKLFIVTFVMALLPILFTSCGEKNQPITIVGEWECVDAIMKYDTDPTGGEDSSEKGQVWKFNKQELTVDGGKSYGYTLLDTKLMTEYAELYESEYFLVNSLTEDNLKLSVSYDDVTKVGKTTITVILNFKRVE